MTEKCPYICYENNTKSRSQKYAKEVYEIQNLLFIIEIREKLHTRSQCKILGDVMANSRELL